MATFLRANLLYGDAMYFVVAMLIWSCPTTQVALPRDPELTAGATLVDRLGGSTDGRLALVSRVGASVVGLTSGVNSEQRSSFDLGAMASMDGEPGNNNHEVGNEVPVGAGNEDVREHSGTSNPAPRSPEELYPAQGSSPQQPGVSRTAWSRTDGQKGGIEGRRGDITFGTRSETPQAGQGRHAGGGLPASRESSRTGIPRPAWERGQPTPTGVGRASSEELTMKHGAHTVPRGDGAHIATDGSDTGQAQRGGEEAVVGEGDAGTAQQQHTTCEKCQKAREEDLLQSFDPDALVQMRIEAIKRKILEKLRMEQPPQVNVSSVNIPAPLAEGTFIEEEDELEGVRHSVRRLGSDVDDDFDTGDDYYGKTTRVIVPAKADTPPCPVSTVTSSCFQFDISSIVRSRVTTAELWLYWTGEESSSESGNHTLVISQLSDHGHHASSTVAIYHAPPTQRAGWVTVDIKHPVRRWRSHSLHNQILQISCPSCESNSVLPLASEPAYRPFIATHVTDDRKTRRRRNIICTENTTDCCRQQFYLRFQDLGWNWVVSPRGFFANYCRGSCSNFNNPLLTHTSIMQGVRSSSANIPQPCCSPRATGSLSMIYLNDQGEFYTVSLPEVRILSCGCS